MADNTPNLKNAAVLLVEDDSECRDFFALVLEQEGVRVTSVATAEEALERLGSAEFDIVATDKNLPNMDGIALIKHIREQYAELPVILITGFGSIKTAVEALKYGARDYLCKPLEDSDELIRAIWNALQQSRLSKENKMLQEQLVNSKRLESLGILAAGIAHEINNPAGFVLGNLELLGERLKGVLLANRKIEELLFSNLPDDSETAEAVKNELESIKKETRLDHTRQEALSMIDDALEGARRIKRIVTGMRGFANPSQGEMALVDVAEEVEKSVALVWNELKYKCELTKDLRPVRHVKGNAGQIDQVLVNLLLNAGQAVPSDAGRIDVRTRMDGDTVLVEVQDNGKGMTEEELGHVFEPFFTTKPVGKGMGLGLFISSGIIRHHGGTMQAESAPGRGAKIVIKLPAA